MDYSIFLELHVTAAVVWIVSMFGISILIAASAGYEPSANRAGINRIRSVNRFLSTPFMILTWVLGITLAIKGGWFGSHWLSVKLVFVLVLSAVHGTQTKTLRKLTTLPATKISLSVRLFPVIVVLCGLAIISLVITKPF